MAELIDIPEHYIDSGMELMSNFDGLVDEDVAAHLIMNEETADYPGWNFHARVWYDPFQKLWYGRVMRYGSHIDTMTAESPSELRIAISDEYGYD